MTKERRRLCGRICLIAGLVGAAQAVVLSAVPAQVGEERFSYPFDATGHAVAQTSFFLQHLGLLPGLAALCVLPAAQSSRAATWGFRAGFVGMVLLAVQELVAIAPARSTATSDLAVLVENLYSVPVLLLGFGLLSGGISLARRTAGTSPAWLRWVPAALGAWVFVPLTPALMGPFLAGRIGIGSWMLVFAALGWGLSRTRRPAWEPLGRTSASASAAPARACA